MYFVLSYIKDYWKTDFSYYYSIVTPFLESFKNFWTAVSNKSSNLTFVFLLNWSLRTCLVSSAMLFVTNVFSTFAFHYFG